MNPESHQKPSYDDSVEIIKINLLLAYAFGFLLPVGIWMWPNDPRWWAFYILSIITNTSAVILIFQQVRAAMNVRKKRRRMDAIWARGNAPSNARLASKSDLQKRGMN